MHETGEIDLEDAVKVEQVAEEVASSPVDDFAQFEEWANRIEEGKLDPDVLNQLKDLLDQGLTLDVDGRSAIDALQGIGIDDPDLEAALEQLAKVNPQADPKDTILGWLAKDDVDAAQSLGYKGGETADETEPVAAPEEMPKEDATSPATPSVREIAEMVYSFFDKETGKFPKGETGVVTHIKKELGDEAGMLAEKLVNHLSGGSVGEAADMDQIPAYVRKEKQRSQQAAQTATDKRNEKSGTKVWKSPRVQEEFESIMKLAGLAK
jgi:hypothetical protein